MTMQEIFNTVLFGLREQAKFSYDYDSCSCFYRLETEEGILKCAAGMCIPDELYTASIEGEKVSNLPSKIASYLGTNNILLLVDLQQLHDGLANAEYEWKEVSGRWEIGMREIAARYKLYYAPLEG